MKAKPYNTFRFDLWRVPPIWEGETIVCIGNGPSLAAEQIDQCKENARLIAINDAYRLAPLADVLYACDARWWLWHQNAPQFLGVRVGLIWDQVKHYYYPGWDEVDTSNIHAISSGGIHGLSTDPGIIKTGHDSGYQAINLAVQLGAKRIVLIGYDMQSKDGKNHWFGDHPDNVAPPPFDIMLPAYESLVEPLKELKIEIFNATPDSALTVFPMAKLEQVV